MDVVVKDEIVEKGVPQALYSKSPGPVDVVELSSSDSDSDSDDVGKRPRSFDGALGNAGQRKRPKMELLPPASLEPSPQLPGPIAMERAVTSAASASCWKQFWKAGNYDKGPEADSASNPVAMDHVRVHPKFLHSNATSHKWVLGALAELLDNSLDEICNGATYVKIDMILDKKDGGRMLLVEDNGGGMDPVKMRQCMSLGYSVKGKAANTIGQYGNGFKTSSMRLGADVIVFSRSHGKERRATQSIGMLSYTFLRNTGKEDIVVPILDYEKIGEIWNKMTQSSRLDWHTKLETIIQWSPYTCEADLLQQFSSMTDQGTRIVIYNLWNDDQGELELDFDTDEHDIQVRGVNRDEKNIQMANQYPNSRHFLMYQHSLRSYASILYLRLPHTFKIILRGKEVEHHSIVTDMMLKQQITYRPQPGRDGVPKDPTMFATVTIGFVKDAKEHIAVQGFNVYHKNRLIKPFWRVWNTAGSDGRGVVGVLEANFVEPAHDKQGFERTIVLSRLEAKLVQMQKTYWSTNCHKIGYAPKRSKKFIELDDRESSPEFLHPSSRRSRKIVSPRNISVHSTEKSFPASNHKVGDANYSANGPAKHLSPSTDTRTRNSMMFGKAVNTCSNPDEMLASSDETGPETDYRSSERVVNGSSGPKASLAKKSFQKGNSLSSVSPCIVDNANMENSASSGSEVRQIAIRSQPKAESATHARNGFIHADSGFSIRQLTDENAELKNRIIIMERSMSQELLQEREKYKLLTEQLQEAEIKLEEASKEQEALIDIFSEERSQRDKEEENLRKKLKDASITIQDLLDKLSCSRNDHIVW